MYRDSSLIRLLLCSHFLGALLVAMDTGPQLLFSHEDESRRSNPLAIVMVWEIPTCFGRYADEAAERVLATRVSRTNVAK